LSLELKGIVHKEEIFAMTKTKYASLRRSGFAAAAVMIVVLMTQGVFAQKLFARITEGSVEIQFADEFSQIIAQQGINLEGSNFEGNFKALGKDSIIPLNNLGRLRYKINNGTLGTEDVNNLADSGNGQGLIFGTGLLRFKANGRRVEFTDFIVKAGTVVQAADGTFRIDVEIQSVLYITSTEAGTEVKIREVQIPLFKGQAKIDPLELFFESTLTLTDINLTFADQNRECPTPPEPCEIADRINFRLDLNNALGKFVKNGKIGLATIFLRIGNP
jgi:hypothetical protein